MIEKEESELIRLPLKDITEEDPKPPLISKVFLGKAEHKGLTAFQAALAWLSTMIGAAIVGLPFAFYYMGIPLGIAINLFMVV